MDENGKTPKAMVRVTWDDDGMHLVMEGAITRDHLIIAGFTITNTAAGLVHREMMEARTVKEREGIVTSPALAGIKRKDA